jgi:hypothetical protein
MAPEPYAKLSTRLKHLYGSFRLGMERYEDMKLADMQVLKKVKLESYPISPLSIKRKTGLYFAL